MHVFFGHLDNTYPSFLLVFCLFVLILFTWFFFLLICRHSLYIMDMSFVAFTFLKYLLIFVTYLFSVLWYLLMCLQIPEEAAKRQDAYFLVQLSLHCYLFPLCFGKYRNGPFSWPVIFLATVCITMLCVVSYFLKNR